MSEPGCPPVIGVIGGSGIYEIDGLTGVEWRRVDSPFGAPSDDLMFGELDGQRVVFLPRHGRGHPIPPSELNFRANIDAMKRSGVTEIISLSAVGSLREDLAPGTFVIVDQFIDRTFARAKSFFGTGMAGHVSMADPVCRRLDGHLEAAAAAAGITAVRGGTYLVMEGPQFSSRAESELYRSWGCDVIGMTNMPEAKLAREAEICYSTLAMVTDYDCWHEEEEDVNGQAVMEVVQQNAATAQDVVRRVIRRLPSERTCGCAVALRDALITEPALIPAATRERLHPIVGKYLESRD